MIPEKDISVGVIEQSGRSENLINPLQSTGMDIAIDPADPHQRDIVIVETPNRKMGYEVLKNSLHSARLVFRMRGDPWFGTEHWIDNTVKKWLAESIMLPHVDGCIATTPYHEQLFEHKTGVQSAVAQLPIDTGQWPDSKHTDQELHIITLTNPNYPPKIKPLIDAMPVVNDVLEKVGGHWRIGGEGNDEDKLRMAAQRYDHISFPGYLNAYEELEHANLMLHLSNLDAYPNAILEAMASRLPVITNDHQSFVDVDRPNLVACSNAELSEQLHACTDPDRRYTVGSEGLEYVAREHAESKVGQDYVGYFQELLQREHFRKKRNVPHPSEVLYDR